MNSHMAMPEDERSVPLLPVRNSVQKSVGNSVNEVSLLQFREECPTIHEGTQRRAFYYTSVFATRIVATFTLIAFAIIAWIIARVVHNGSSWTAGALIGSGGSFSQPQAKLVDLVCSSVIAPLIMALFNYYCFKIARTWAVNEYTGRRHNISLQALVEVSTTDHGSYAPIKLYTLLQTHRLRIILLAAITLLSAISYSALANVVAYEAYTHNGANTTTSLQYLYPSPTHLDNSSQLPLLSTTQQNAEFASQWFTVLTSLGYISADQYLDEGAYVNINMTNASLARVPSGITDLLSVPAYRLTYNCKPSTPDIPFSTMMGAVDQQLVISVSEKNPLNNTETLPYTARIWNGASAILSADNDQYESVAFGMGLPSYSFYLGSIGSFNTSNYTSITSFGPLKHMAFNNTLSPLPGQSSLGTKYVLSMWGVVCSVSRQTGNIDLHRNGDFWTRTPGQFSDDRTAVPLLLNDLQLDPSYISPIQGAFAGIGGALAASTNITNASETESNYLDYPDFATWANNCLYAEGEAQRIAYEIASTVPSSDSADDANLGYGVQAQSGLLRYRMTFVPWILIFGLLSLVLVGLIVLPLAVVKELAMSEGRVVTPLRVVIDAGAGLESESFQGMERWGDEEIDGWGAKQMVRYVRVDDRLGKEVVSLKQA